MLVPTISLKTRVGVVVQHKASDMIQFTTRDLLNAVLETEKQYRTCSNIHAYLEGLREDVDGSWRVYWGS